MPHLVLYDGRPIKRRRLVSQGLRLTFVSPVLGRRGTTVVVSQEDWQRHGTVQFFTRQDMPDVQALARQFES